MSKLRDQVAVVTGASSGIGKAIALGLAAQGAKLCLIGRDLASLYSVVDSVKMTAPCVRSYQIDLTNDDDIQKLRMCIQRDFGQVDILIHSAGAFTMGMIESASVKDLDQLYKTNVRAPYLLTQILLPMIKSHRGQIIFINSSVGLNAKANVSQYAATKHALKAIADSLRAEVSTCGIRVLSIYPGRTATPMQAAVHEMEGKEYKPEQFMQPDDIATMIINALSLPRSAEVTDIHIRPFIKFE
jgi:NADP-dependent 3-hydroxy acid dehydrogenase YdfG